MIELDWRILCVVMTVTSVVLAIQKAETGIYHVAGAAGA